jgi:GH43 family beta-xylosidase
VNVFANAVVSYSNVQYGYQGEGNISSDPKFVGNGDYHLKQISPCIDSGASDNAPSTDIEGNSRPKGGGYDMGAYEYDGFPIRPPTVETSAISSVTAYTATSGGEVTSYGGASVMARGVCWSTSSNPTTANGKTTNGTGTGSFTSSITGLNPGTIYHVRAYATNSAGTAYGNDLTFTTSTTAPNVSTTEVSPIAETSASSGGNVTSDGGATVTARGVCWSTSANATTANSKTTNGTGTGSFTSSMIGLNPGTTYHVRAYATNSEGTAYGNDLTFTTSTTNPTVTTTAVSSVTANSATSGGNVISDGGSTITARGVCWSTSSNPTTANGKTTNGTGTGSFTSSITGLNPGTIYHVRAYATNSAGTAYGNDLTFTTSTTAPNVSTTEVSPIAETSASRGGNVTSDGGATVTARGVCWSTSANPTTANSKTTNGTGTGSFTSSMIGLNPGTTYHVRAYATNSAGTSYGNDISFETPISYDSTLYVSSDGNCGTKTPCFSSIQSAINSASANSVIMVRSDTYEESLSLGTSKSILIKGGYSSNEYNQQVPNTTFIEAVGPTTIRAPSGSLKLQLIDIK